MSEYITLDEAKKHLNVDADFIDDDSYIAECVSIAVDIVCADSCREISSLLNFDGGLNKIAKSAMLLKVGDLYAYRESAVHGSMSEVPNGYSRLISLIRSY